MYTPEQIQNVKIMRKTHTSEEIALMMGKSKGAIDQIIHREKKKGYTPPKLRHGNLKWDKAKAEEWRNMVRAHMNYKQIEEIEGVKSSVICRALAQEARGEMGW